VYGVGDRVIDWPPVALNVLWIIGCAVILAAFSYANWMAHMHGVSTRHLLRAPSFQLPFLIGMGLISLGLFVLSRSWLERLLWGVCIIFFVLRLWELWRTGQR
jgi:hypothetical protein